MARLPHQIPTPGLKIGDDTVDLPDNQPQTGQVLTYSGTSGQMHWNYVEGAGGGPDTHTDIQDEGSTVKSSTGFIDFAGDGVTATASGSGVRVEITGGGGGSALDIQDEGVSVESATEFIDFAGANVTVTSSGTNGVRVEITDTAGGGDVAVEDEGVEVQAAASRFNFVGSGVFVEDAGSGEVTVTVSGAGESLVLAEGDYLTATLSTDQLNPADTAPILWDVVENSRGEGVVLDTVTNKGRFTLKAGRTFIVNCSMRISDSVAVGRTYELWDLTANEAVAGSLRRVFNATATNATGGSQTLTIPVAPVVETEYEIRMADSQTVTTDILAAGSALNIYEMGGNAVPSSLEIRDAGVTVSGTATCIDFAGPGVVATQSGTCVRVEVNATGGGGDVAVEDEGSEVLAAASRFNFIGDGVTVTDAGGGEVTVTISGAVEGVGPAKSPRWELVGEYEVTSDVTDFELPVTLDGDTDERYLIEWDILNDTTTTEYSVRPNGISANQRSAYHVFGDGSTHTRGEFATLHLINTAEVESFGQMTLQAKTGDGVRKFTNLSMAGHTAGTQAFGQNSSGYWNDTSTNITSLTIHASVASKILTGSKFSLYRKGTPIGSPSIEVLDDGVTVDANVNHMDFVGAGVFVETTTSGIQVTVSGGGGGGGDVAVEDEGSQVVAEASTFNFTGNGVEVSDAGSGQVDISIPSAGFSTGGMWKFVETVEVTGSAASELGFTGLNGDVDEEYLIVYHIKHAEPGTTRDFRLRVNDLDSGSNIAATNQNSAGGSVSFGDMVFSRTVRDHMSGHLWFVATENPEGSSVAMPRTFRYHHSLGDDPASSSAMFDQSGAGIWTDSGVNVTSLKIESTVTTVDTASTSLAVGSVMSLFKRVPNSEVNGVTGHASALEFVDKIEVGADTTTVTFGVGGDGNFGTALDGNLDEEYVLSWYIPDPGATCAFELRPNGLTTNQVGTRHYGGTSHNDFTTTRLHLEQGAASGYTLTGEGTLFAATGKRRGWVGRNGLFGSSSFGIDYFGQWTDTSTNITSIDITCTVASAIKSGAEFTLWRRRAIPTGARPIEVLDEGVTVKDNVTHIDFVGDPVTVTTTSSGVQVAVSGTGGGGGSALDIEDEGVSVEAATEFIDFVGNGVTATASGTNGVRVEIPGATLGNLQFVDVIEVEADTQTVTFGAGGDGLLGAALDGDVDEAYLIEFHLPVATATTNQEIRPNGVTSNLIGASGYQGQSQGSGESTTLLYAASPSGRGTQGTIDFQAKSGKPRAFQASTFESDLSTQSWRYDFAGAWTDTTTNVTSIDLHATTSIGIKEGARFVLWRRTSNNVRADSASIYERSVTAGVSQGSSSGAETYTTGRASFGGSAVGLSATLIDDTVTAGTIDVSLLVDNAAVLDVTLDTGNTQFHRAALPVGMKQISPGDEIEVNVSYSSLTTTSGGSPAVVVNATFTNDAFVKSPVGADYLVASLSANQTTNLNVNEHIEFDSSSSRGSSISLATGAGQANGLFTLQPGKTYEVHCNIGAVCNEGSASIQWTDDSDDSELIDDTGNGLGFMWFRDNAAHDNVVHPTQNFFITPTVALTIKLMVITDLNLTTIYDSTRVTIKEFK